MGEKNSKKPDGEPVKAEEKQAEAPKFLVGKLREACVELFGITSSTFDGAFYGCSASEMTIEEARARINNWLGGKEK